MKYMNDIQRNQAWPDLCKGAVFPNKDEWPEAHSLVPRKRYKIILYYNHISSFADKDMKNSNC